MDGAGCVHVWRERDNNKYGWNTMSTVILCAEFRKEESFWYFDREDVRYFSMRRGDDGQIRAVALTRGYPTCTFCSN